MPGPVFSSNLAMIWRIEKMILGFLGFKRHISPYIFGVKIEGKNSENWRLRPKNQDLRKRAWRDCRDSNSCNSLFYIGLVKTWANYLLYRY